jgi:hypothetical protein
VKLHWLLVIGDQLSVIASVIASHFSVIGYWLSVIGYCYRLLVISNQLSNIKKVFAVTKCF